MDYINHILENFDRVYSQQTAKSLTDLSYIAMINPKVLCLLI